MMIEKIYYLSSRILRLAITSSDIKGLMGFVVYLRENSHFFQSIKKG